MGSRVIVLPVLEELKELLRPTLFEEPHQRTPDSFELCAWNFRYLSIAEDVGGGDLLELEIPSDFSVNEHVCQFARGDDEFRDEIDCVVSVTTEVLGRFHAISEVLVHLVSSSEILSEF